MRKSFKQFLEKNFPILDPFKRKENGLIHNFIKWVAIRISYILYRFGISANMLDIFSMIFLIPIFYLIVHSIMIKDIFYFIIGFILVCIVILVDFIDGPLAKSNRYKFAVGDNLDNLCPDIIKSMSFIVIGLLTENEYFVILSILTAIIISNYVSITHHAILKKDYWIIKLFLSKMSLNGFRVFVCFIVPLLISLYILDFRFIDYLAKLIILLYLFISLIWLFLTFKSAKLKK